MEAIKIYIYIYACNNHRLQHRRAHISTYPQSTLNLFAGNQHLI